MSSASTVQARMRSPRRRCEDSRLARRRAMALQGDRRAANGSGLRAPRRLESTGCTNAARSQRSIQRGVGTPGVVIPARARLIGAIATRAISLGRLVQAQLVVERLRAYAGAYARLPPACGSASSCAGCAVARLRRAFLRDGCSEACRPLCEPAPKFARSAC